MWFKSFIVFFVTVYLLYVTQSIPNLYKAYLLENNTNINKTCEECSVIDDQINVDCFRFNNITNKSTCKIYYEICQPVECKTVIAVREYSSIYMIIVICIMVPFIRI